ncbi:FxSxx-COOH system tetratricopeptide repeat protein [Streptomyces bungoensis]
MSADEHPLLIEPVVAWPRQAETECDYLVTVDLRGPLPAPDGAPPSWPYREEEFSFSISLDGAPAFVCSALDEPRVVLHRFGGTYGPARFRVSAGSEPGPASLWLTVSNQWGVPVRKAELRSRIHTRRPEQTPVGKAVEQVRFSLGDPLPGPAPAPRSAPEPESGRAVTVCCAGPDRAWATWIGDRLERHGATVTHRRWDPGPSAALDEALPDLVHGPGAALLVLSGWFFRLGSYRNEHWETALRTIARSAGPSRVAAVTVVRMPPLPAVVGVLENIDVADRSAEEAEQRILDWLGIGEGPAPAPADAPRFPASIPRVWQGVPRRNVRFTGRDRLLDDIDQRLRDDTEHTALVLHGMSGVGKTQLAAEYVYRFGSEYDVVWWVGAENRVSYRRGLAGLAPELGLQTGREYGERLRAVRDSLRRGDPYARWLLVLDGADEPDQIWDLVPTGPGHVLITSRNPEWGEHNSKLLEVRVYDRDESVAFIRRRAPRLDEAEADQLAEALEDLPLLLDQTAGWLNDSDLSVEQYIGLLEGGVDQDVVKVSADFPVAFRTAWSILLDRLRETVPESVDLLRLCTFFAPGFVPVRLLREVPGEGLPDRLAALLEDPLLWNRAIGLLRQYSVVRWDPYETAPDRTASSEAVYLHRMVHQIVRQGMPEADRREFIEVVRRALAGADPGRPTDTRCWDAYAEIVPHLRYADVLRSQDHDVQELVLNCLRYLWFVGEYGEGVNLGERALRTWRHLLGESHPRVGEVTYHYANLLRSAGRFEETEAIDRAAMERLREQRGERDLEYLRMAGGLGADLRSLARYDEALELDESLCPAYRDLLGEQDSRTLNALNNFGFTLRLLGRYEEALGIDLKTLEARRRVLEGRHPWTLFSEVSYAIDLRLLGRYAEAGSVQERNVREYRSVIGPDHQDTLRAQHNLALCRLRGGDRAAAGELLGQVLAGYERKLGETHMLTLAAAVSRSCFAREQGDLDQAGEAGESVVARYETLLPAGHPFTIGARANQALVLSRAGEAARAYAVIERALAGMRDAVGPDHPYTLGLAVNAAALRGRLDDEGAAALSADTVARAARTLGRTHPLTLAARVGQAADLRRLRRRERAAKVEQEAVADLAATLGAQHPQTVAARARTRPLWDFEPQAS